MHNYRITLTYNNGEQRYSTIEANSLKDAWYDTKNILQHADHEAVHISVVKMAENHVIDVYFNPYEIERHGG